MPIIRTPLTTLQYQLPKTSHMSLNIYNLLGQQIQILVNEVKQPGYYEVQWDGKNIKGQEVSSGLYLVRIVAGEFDQTKKMVLMK